ncbi:MAG: serine hydrolase domain-containing protein [Archangium sp.]|nr:serine hydrolase domain-containing protein [Archangium sp.]
MNSLDALLQRGVDEQVYPLARLEVFHEGRHALSLGNAPSGCVFDLASVTKVMCTTALVLDTRLPVDAPLTQFLPGAAARATLADLLFHRSGLPAFQPYFEHELLAHPELFEGAQPGLRASVRRSVLARVAATPQERTVGSQAVYSDLGFILLGAVLEASTGTPLDRLFTERIAAPLGLTAGFRRLSSALPLPAVFAPTGTTRPREPAPGQEGLWNVPERPTGLCEVDDDNAWCLDGVSGHAGLFGTALDVARFGQAILEGQWLRPEAPWGRDGTPGSTRTFGFDTPSTEGASCGQRFGKRGASPAIGHLGFTGTSLWIDLDRRLVVAFLTNRVALGRANIRIRAFRPQVHDAVLDALKLE